MNAELHVSLLPTNAIIPSDEMLKADLLELQGTVPKAGIKALRKLLKEKHPSWQVSENRVRQALIPSRALGQICDAKQAPGAQRHQVNGHAQLPEGCDPKDFLAWLSERAAAGDAAAQHDMSVMHTRGVPGFLKKNEKLGDQWLERAATNPDAAKETLTDYGMSLKFGTKHIQQNLSRAAQVFERAFQLGDSLGTYHLADMLQNGDGVPQKQPERAMQLWKLVADGNLQSALPSSQPHLKDCEIPESMYEYGSRCQDRDEKLCYLRMAAKRNLARAQFKLFQELISCPESEDIPLATQRTAAKWYRAAKRQGFVEPIPVLLDSVEDMGVEAVYLAMQLRGGIEFRSTNFFARKQRVLQLASMPLLSEFEEDDD
jgi:TPR repeat protein